MSEEQLKQDMQKALVVFVNELKKIRTGRAHPSLLDQVMVDYYGSLTPLPQTANVVAEGARSLLVTPWDKSVIPEIEKAIIVSDLGLNPASQGDCIRIPMPALTSERRQDLVKLVRQEGEKAKIVMRNLRRGILSDAKEELKEKLITEDDERRLGQVVQKITDEFIEKVDQEVKEKEKDLMTV